MNLAHQIASSSCPRWLTVFLLSAALLAHAHPLDKWHLRYSVPSGGYLSVTCGEGLFVAVGTQGRLATSADGTHWADQSPGLSVTLHSVAYGAQTFVTVGEGGTILSSPDGTNWTPRVSGTTARLLRVRFGSGVFLATGESGALLTSPNGTDWGAQNAGASFYPYFIACGNGLFLLEGNTTSNLISPDGTNWFSRPSGTTYGLYTVGFGKGRFMSIDTRSRVFTSTDASNWTQRGSVQVIRPSEVAYGNGYFVAVGNGPPEYSSSGDLWIQAPTNLFASAIVFGPGTFVLTAGSRIWQSDPVVWLDLLSAGHLVLEGPVGRVYGIKSAEDLNPSTSWELRTNFTLMTSPQTWNDPVMSSTQRFYRAVLLP